MSLISPFTWAEALSDASKVATSASLGGGLQAQSLPLPKLRPQVMRVRLPLHHLGEVACELDLAFYPG